MFNGRGETVRDAEEIDKCAAATEDEELGADGKDIPEAIPNVELPAGGLAHETPNRFATLSWVFKHI